MQARGISLVRKTYEISIKKQKDFIGISGKTIGFPAKVYEISRDVQGVIYPSDATIALLVPHYIPPNWMVLGGFGWFRVVLGGLGCFGLVWVC